MPFLRGKKGQKGRHVWKSSCLHCQILDAYRDACDARDALRESGTEAPGWAGAAYYQLEDADFNELHPPIRLKDWLEAHRGYNRSEAGEGPATSVEEGDDFW